jgi:hypothetical protein
MNAQLNLKHCNPDGLINIPMPLKTLRHWVTWKAGPIDPSTGKFTKYPIGKDGGGKGWPNPEQWVGELEEALTFAKMRGHSGVGIVLPAMIYGLHLAIFDLDGVDFKDAERMREIVRIWVALGKPYMEISPSGKGLRFFVLSKTPVPDASCARPSGGKDELYCSSKARWMTVTGNQFKPGGLPEATEAALAISARWNANKAPPKGTSVKKVSTSANKQSILGHLTAREGFEWPKERIKDGEDREYTMLRFAGHLRSKGTLSQEEIEKLCLIANIEHYAEPLNESVVLDRARRYGGKQQQVANLIDDWAELEELPPRYRAAPALDTDLLPSSISAYVADCANRMRIPAEMIATPLLVALGSVFGKKVCVQPRSKDTSWIEYPNFWGVSILPPAMLKSPSLNAAMKFINELEALAQHEYANAMSAWDSDERVRRLDIRLMESKARKALESGDRIGAKRQLDLASQVKPPVRKRYVISDATPEARLEILCENPNGVLLLRDELDGHIAQLKKDGYENARAQELQFFDGHQDYSDDRIKRGSHIAEGPRMALYGNLQPAKVEKYLMEMHKGGSDDGYIQRMLQLAVQPTITEEFELLDIRPSIEAEGAVRDLFKAAQSMRLDRNSLTQRIMPKVLKFDPNAQVEFDQFFVALENKLRSGGISNPVIAAHFGKYRGTLPKLALVMALAIDPFATSISLEAFRKAVSLLLFYREHAIRIYGVVTRGDLSSAYELLERIKKGQLNDGFNPRDDIQRKEWQGLRTSREVDAAIDLLVKHNHLRIVEVATNGRSKRTVQIHPNLIRQKGTKVVT